VTSYGMTPKANALEFPLLLNHKMAQREPLCSLSYPGLTPNVKDNTSYTTNSSIQPSASDSAHSPRTPRVDPKLNRMKAEVQLKLQPAPRHVGS
jgi:hypothetical protein